MSKETIREIKSNYNLYNSILRDKKSMRDRMIIIQNVGNNANILESNHDVKHVIVENQISLRVNVKVNNYNFFQFKLRCPDLCAVPFFRYDSDGEAHRNYDESTPLDQQQIPTPHFHFYNSEGVNIAYQTDKILDVGERAALEDINICIKYFCHEANLRLNDDDFPEVEILPSEMSFRFTNDDPNSNVNFL